ncbi:MAG: hypothetical protein QOF36_2631 [Microbacteriaceae bacterium]|jgi:hypothetical protein|nr:hypothetical protein [Microbacteriaceae bacterium]
MPDNDFSLTVRHDDVMDFHLNGDAPFLVDMGDGTLRKVVNAHELNDEYGSCVLVLGGEAVPNLRDREQRPLVGKLIHGD